MALAQPKQAQLFESLPVHPPDSDEWYTPQPVVELARQVMGSIDLDPMTSDMAQAAIQAARYYTAQTDGLSQTWTGNVWLNPPYSRELIARSIEHFIIDYLQGGIHQACVLVNSDTSTAWYRRLMQHKTGFCMPPRLKFWGPNTDSGGARYAQTLFYFNRNGESDKFIETFRILGWAE